MFICLVRGRIFGVRAISNAPELSLKRVQRTFSVAWCTAWSIFCWICFNEFISGIVLRNAWLMQMYSASVLDNATSILTLTPTWWGEINVGDSVFRPRLRCHENFCCRRLFVPSPTGIVIWLPKPEIHVRLPWVTLGLRLRSCIMDSIRKRTIWRTAAAW